MNDLSTFPASIACSRACTISPSPTDDESSPAPTRGFRDPATGQLSTESQTAGQQVGWLLLLDRPGEAPVRYSS